MEPSENLQSATKRLQIVVPVSLLLVFVLLGDVRQRQGTVLVFTGIPFALTGASCVLAGHSDVYLCGRRLHGAPPGWRYQWSGDDFHHPQLEEGGDRALDEAIRDGGLTWLTAGADDCPGGLAGIHSNGPLRQVPALKSSVPWPPW